jgi:hypothetical protein
LDKGKNLEYRVDGAPGFIESVRTITNYKWSKENRGKEAENNGNAGKLPASRSVHNIANESTSFRGHHLMQCQILEFNKVKETLKFGIFIK